METERDMILPTHARLPETADPGRAPPSHSGQRAQGAGEPLDARAERLFDSLPEEHRLAFTRERFPHVLNRIAADWDTPKRLLQRFDELLIDQRGNRQGFPFQAMVELANLRDYYVANKRSVLPALPTRRDPHAWHR